MNEIDVNKAVITAINGVILMWLPCMLVWHIVQIRKFIHLSYDWTVQLLIIFCYCLAVNCEIPALWSRLYAYYNLKLTMPELLYTLTTWDRWGHVLFYAFFSLLTVIVTRKSIPQPIKDILS